MATFFTADIHCVDHRTIDPRRRPFPDTATMDAHLIERRNRQHRRTPDLHGHSHSRLKPIRRPSDVGVDLHHWPSVTLTQLLAHKA